MTVSVIADTAQYDAILEKSKQEGTLVIIDFHAVWCGPCKMLAPKIEALSDEHSTVEFYKLDVDEVKEVARRCGITAMPTIHAYKNGVKVGEVVGFNEGAIVTLITKNK